MMPGVYGDRHAGRRKWVRIFEDRAKPAKSRLVLDDLFRRARPRSRRPENPLKERPRLAPDPPGGSFERSWSCFEKSGRHPSLN
jgi:hypothetical protein